MSAAENPYLVELDTDCLLETSTTSQEQNTLYENIYPIMVIANEISEPKSEIVQGFVPTDIEDYSQIRYQHTYLHFGFHPPSKKFYMQYAYFEKDGDPKHADPWNWRFRCPNMPPPSQKIFTYEIAKATAQKIDVHNQNDRQGRFLTLSIKNELPPQEYINYEFKGEYDKAFVLPESEYQMLHKWWEEKFKNAASKWNCFSKDDPIRISQLAKDLMMPESVIPANRREDEDTLLRNREVEFKKGRDATKAELQRQGLYDNNIIDLTKNPHAYLNHQVHPTHNNLSPHLRPPMHQGEWM